MDNSSLQTGSYNLPGKKSSKGKRFLFILIALIVLGGLLYGGKKLIGSKLQKAQKPEATPTPTEVVFPTETPTPEITETLTPTVSLPTSTPTPSKRPVNPIDKATGLDRSKLSVEVQNGGGVAGAASKGSETLKNLGYKIAGIGNADNYDYQNVVIKTKSDKSDYLPLLKKDLSASYSIGNTSSDLSASSSADAVVIIGK